MPTTKELIEAAADERRRLVRTVVSGPDAEVRRPLRAVACSLGIALLTLVGAVLAGVLDRDVVVDLGSPGLIQVEETGEHYVVLDGDPTLRPVANLTSARLLLGSAPRVETVPERALDDAEIGPPVGIPGAPPVPDRDRLSDDPWTVCAAGDAIQLTIGAAARPADPAAAAFVRSDGTTYLVTDGHRFEFAGHRGLAPATVPSDWLALLPEGARLTEEGLGDYFERYGAGHVLATDLCIALDGTGVRLVEPPTGPAESSYVQLAGSEDRFLVQQGIAYPLSDPGAFGYDDREPLVVPAKWLALLPTGPELSAEAALSGQR